jgi:hypothetical protein
MLMQNIQFQTSYHGVYMFMFNLDCHLIITWIKTLMPLVFEIIT